jgi:HTH-type transcriptional regulator / antitoxin HigA
MDSTNQSKFEWTAVPHPGETVLEYLEFNGWSQRDLARRTDLTPKTISEICNGKGPITPTTALAFEKVFQRPAHFWLNLQREFDEAEARRKEFAKTAGWKEWAANFPVKEMKKLNFYLTEGSRDAAMLLNFFGVSSPDSWDAVWEASAVAYRQTRKLKTRRESVAVWVREVELLSRELEVLEFEERRLRDCLENLRPLTRQRADEILEPMQDMCAAAGVAVVLVPELPNTAISGCARWLSDKKALVGLTLRYKTDDQFWFTLFHELGHILLHRNKHSFIVDNAVDDLSDQVVDPEMQRFEAEANRFAADTLIPPRELTDFIRKKAFTNDSIHEFAEILGVGPGIVVGRLQHEGLLARHQGNALKQKLGSGLVDER